MASFFGGNITISGNGIVTGADMVKGNGKMATFDYSNLELDGVRILALSCSADIQLNVNPECKKPTVILNCEENLKDNIRVVADGNMLELDSKGSYSTNKPILLEVELPRLDKIMLISSGSIVGNYIGEKLNVSLTGSGTIKLVGEADDLVANLKGSGDIQLKKLAVTNGKLVLQGSGDLVANISENADLLLQGSGDIEVYGNPSNVTKKAQGSGDITLKQGTAPKKESKSDSGKTEEPESNRSKQHNTNDPFSQMDKTFDNVFGNFNNIFSDMDASMKNMQSDLDKKMQELNKKVAEINTENLFKTSTINAKFPSTEDLFGTTMFGKSLFENMNLPKEEQAPTKKETPTLGELVENLKQKMTQNDTPKEDINENPPEPSPLQKKIKKML